MTNEGKGNSRHYKTRHLTMTAYFEQLQLEYIVAELRKKIYPKIKDKNYYQRVAEQKRNNIEDIASRNKIPSIFNDNNTKDLFYNKVYNEWGPPAFLYKDDAHKMEYENWDLINYYLKDNDVKFRLEGQDQIFLGKIINFDLKNKEITIKENISNEVDTYKIENVTRIL